MVEDEDNNEYFRDNFVVDVIAEKEQDKASMPRRKNNNKEDSDEDNDSDKTKGRKR